MVHYFLLNYVQNRIQFPICSSCYFVIFFVLRIIKLQFYKVEEYFRSQVTLSLSFFLHSLIPTLRSSRKNFNEFIFSFTIFPLIANNDENNMKNSLIFIIFSLLLFEFISIFLTCSLRVGLRGNE